jgi:hypothetical protein
MSDPIQRAIIDKVDQMDVNGEHQLNWLPFTRSEELMTMTMAVSNVSRIGTFQHHDHDYLILLFQNHPSND